MTKADIKMMRRLVVALECVRIVCEHADGLRAKDRASLARGMCVAIDACHAVRHLIPDYQKDSFWEEVRALAFATK